VRQRRPRIQRTGYLAWIRDLPCAICWTDVGVEAAHLRFAYHPAGKSITGVGTKPHDTWTLPLCQRHHTLGNEAQHNAKCSERDWWLGHGIDPVYLAALLWLHFSNGDRDAASHVIMHARSLGK
jgi:hypothetical protein